MIEDRLKESFINTLLSVDRIEANEIVEKLLAEHGNITLIEDLVVESLSVIGDGWETGRYALSQVYMSGIICEEIMDKVIAVSDIVRKKAPKMAIGVLLDYHALGKRIVTSVIKSSGYEIYDFGYGLSVEEIVEKTVEEDIEILMISTLMLPSALKVKEVKEELMKAGKVTKIIVGGAPFRFDEELWERVGADVDGKNATDIVGILEGMVGA